MFSESVLAGLPFPSRQSFRIIFAPENVLERLNTVSSQCARVYRLLHENRKSIPKFLSGKKLLKM